MFIFLYNIGTVISRAVFIRKIVFYTHLMSV